MVRKFIICEPFFVDLLAFPLLPTLDRTVLCECEVIKNRDFFLMPTKENWKSKASKRRMTFCLLRNIDFFLVFCWVHRFLSLLFGATPKRENIFNVKLENSRKKGLFYAIFTSSLAMSNRLVEKRSLLVHFFFDSLNFVLVLTRSHIFSYLLAAYLYLWNDGTHWKGVVLLCNISNQLLSFFSSLHTSMQFK